MIRVTIYQKKYIFFLIIFLLSCSLKDKNAGKEKEIRKYKNELKLAVDNLDFKLTNLKKNVKGYEKLKEYKEIKDWLDEWEPNLSYDQERVSTGKKKYNEMIKTAEKFTENIEKILKENKAKKEIQKGINLKIKLEKEIRRISKFESKLSQYEKTQLDNAKDIIKNKNWDNIDELKKEQGLIYQANTHISDLKKIKQKATKKSNKNELPLNIDNKLKLKLEKEIKRIEKFESELNEDEKRSFKSLKQFLVKASEGIDSQNLAKKADELMERLSYSKKIEDLENDFFNILKKLKTLFKNLLNNTKTKGMIKKIPLKSIIKTIGSIILKKILNPEEVKKLQILFLSESYKLKNGENCYNLVIDNIKGHEHDPIDRLIKYASVDSDYKFYFDLYRFYYGFSLRTRTYNLSVGKRLALKIISRELNIIYDFLKEKYENFILKGNEEKDKKNTAKVHVILEEIRNKKKNFNDLINYDEEIIKNVLKEATTEIIQKGIIMLSSIYVANQNSDISNKVKSLLKLMKQNKYISKEQFADFYLFSEKRIDLLMEKNELTYEDCSEIYSQLEKIIKSKNRYRKEFFIHSSRPSWFEHLIKYSIDNKELEIFTFLLKILKERAPYLAKNSLRTALVEIGSKKGLIEYSNVLINIIEKDFPNFKKEKTFLNFNKIRE